MIVESNACGEKSALLVFVATCVKCKQVAKNVPVCCNDANTWASCNGRAKRVIPLLVVRVVTNRQQKSMPPCGKQGEARRRMKAARKGHEKKDPKEFLWSG